MFDSGKLLVYIKGAYGAHDQSRKDVHAHGQRLKPYAPFYINNGEVMDMDMDVNAVVQFVQGVGFPIACAIALFYLLYQDMQQRIRDANERALRDSEMARVIAENTAATNSLRDLVKSLHGEDHA